MFREGQVVYSVAGRDAQEFYVIMRCEAGFCFIADGRRRRMENPKKKNPKHLRGTKKEVDLAAVTSNRCLRRILKTLCQGETDETGRECQCPSRM